MTIPIDIAQCNATSLVKNVLTELYDNSFSPLTPTAGNIPVGSGTAWVSTVVSGDITITSAGVVAIGATKVTNAMLAGSIADTKLSTISTAGKVANSATTATNANTASAIVARDASGNFTAGTITAALTGNASTATALANGRTIGGVSFDGTANITVASATGGFAVSGGALAVGANDITCTGSLGATGARLTKGWFTDLQVTNAISGSITGNAATATALAAGRTIAITGDIAYTSPLFDGSGNVTAIGTLPTVNSNVGSFGSATQVGTFTVNGKGLITAASNTTVTPAVGSITGLGTGVATALGVNIGSAGAPVLFNGAGGTPSSITLTNASGTAASLTAGNVTTNANLTGPITSTGNATAVTANAITNAMLRTSAGLSVVGRSANTTGNVADITASSDSVLRSIGTALAFGSIDLANSSLVSGILANANTTATSANTASAIVARDSSGAINIGDFSASRSNSGGNVTGTISNTSNTSSSNAKLVISVAGASGGDAFVNYNIASGQAWAEGIDISDSSAYVISASSTPGTTNALRISTAGEVTKPLQPSFLAYNSAIDSDVTGDNTLYTVICDTEIFDKNSDYNNATGVFTAPVTDTYNFHGLALLQGLGSANTNGGAVLVTSNRSYYAYDNVGARRNSGNEAVVTISQPWADMDAGDTASFAVSANNGTKVVDVYGTGGTAMQTFFSGGLN